MARVVEPETWRAIELIAAQPITAELPTVEHEPFPDYKLDHLILAARTVANDDDPI